MGSRLLALAIVLLSLTAPAGSQEWTRFRGPNGTGISATSSISTEVTPTNTVWRAELPGIGHSSPVLWGDRLFITSAENDKGIRHLVCLDARTGKSIWTRDYPFTPYHTHEFNTTASSTPTVDAQRVYATWPTPDSYLVVATDHNGKELWRQDLGKLYTQHGGATSPVLAGGVVMLGVYQEQPGAEGFLVGLDQKTGAIRWKIPRKQNQSSAYSSPLLYHPKGGGEEAIFTSTAHGITSVDPKTGKVNWEAGGLFAVRCVASPVLCGNLIFATAGEGGGTKLAVAVHPPGTATESADSGSAKEPRVAYRMDRGPSYAPTPVSVGDRIFAWGDGGIVTCIKAETGERVWTERVGGNFFGSPICVAGRLYAVSAKGELVVVEASDQFKVLGRSDLGEASHATPAVANGRLYIRTLSHVICVGQKR